MTTQGCSNCGFVAVLLYEYLHYSIKLQIGGALLEPEAAGPASRRRHQSRYCESEVAKIYDLPEPPGNVFVQSAMTVAIIDTVNHGDDGGTYRLGTTRVSCLALARLGFGWPRQCCRSSACSLVGFILF